MPYKTQQAMDPWHANDARNEARQIYRMIFLGTETVESIRTLIDIPPALKEEFLDCPDPAIALHLEQIVAYREAVMAYFNKIVKEKGSTLVN